MKEERVPPPTKPKSDPICKNIYLLLPCYHLMIDIDISLIVTLKYSRGREEGEERGRKR